MFYNLSAVLSAGLIADIAICAVLLLFVVLGLINGFTKIFFKVVGRLASLILAFVLCAKFVGFIDEKFQLVAKLGASIEGFLPKVFGDALMNTSLNDITNNPELVTGANGLSSLIVKLVMSIIDSSASIDKTITLSQILAPTFAYYIILAGGFVVLYILIRIAFFLLFKLISGLFKIKLLNALDKILGGALGFIQGYFVVYLLIFLLGILPLGFAKTAIEAINLSTVGAFISSINIFDMLAKALNSFDYIKDFIISKFPVK